MKHCHVTHIDCDAVGCLLVMDYFGEEFDEVLAMDYHAFQKEDFSYDQFLEYDSITFTDMSPDQELLDLILDNNIKLLILDHHESWNELLLANIEKLEALENKGNVEIIFDPTKSGTKITFEYLKSRYPNKKIDQTLIEIVENIDTYDLFKSERDNWEDAQNMNRLLWSNYLWAYSKTNSAKKFDKYIKLLKGRLESNPDKLVFNMYDKNSLVTTKIREQDVYKQAISNMLVRTDERGIKFGIIKVKSKVSITAFTILGNYPSLSYLIIINCFNKDEMKLSGRARKGFNLLGLKHTKGHAQACGTQKRTQRYIGQLWRGQSIYELGYDTDYIDEPDKILEKISKVY